MRKIYSKTRTLKPEKTIEDDLFLIGVALFGILVIAAAVTVIHPELWLRIKLPPCLFHLFSGYYCPGCGGTRAIWALFHGHLLQAAYFHPFVPYSALLYFYFMMTQTIERLSHQHFPIGMRYRNCYIWIGVIILMGNFIVKNILHHFYGFVL